MLASEVFEVTRSKLNDVEGQIFTNTVLLPYLVSAYEVLQSEIQNNGIPITSEHSSALTVPSGTLVLSSSSTPPLPTDLIEPIALFERSNSTQRWEEMQKFESVPIPSTDYSTKLYAWYWTEEEIKFFGATTEREVLIKYIKGLPSITGEATNIPLRGAKEYLALKTAANAAEDIGQNRSRADRLESKAEVEKDKYINIRVKSEQGHCYTRPTRRKTWPSLSLY